MADYPRILLVDSYDSFTHNLASLCKSAIPHCRVHIIRNDDLSIETLISVLQHFHAIVIGPGPGSPDIPEDVGIIRDLWRLPHDYVLPIFGVCLGLQSLALHFGASLKRLNVVKHGQISQLTHSGSDLFKGVALARVVRYHSLHVQLVANGDIEELASVDDIGENGHVVMAARHRTNPFWAVQYHPESTCTAGGGIEVMRNFWRLSTAWSVLNERIPPRWNPSVERLVGPPWPSHSRVQIPPTLPSSQLHRLSTVSLHLPHISVHQTCESFGACDEASPFALLESAADPGRFSIVCCVDQSSLRMRYHTDSSHIEVTRGSATSIVPLESSDIWCWLKSFMRSRRFQCGRGDIPFWGGLVGYLSYELGVAGISPDTSSHSLGGRHPDANLVFVERSVVVDHHTGMVHIQTLKPQDGQWLTTAADLVGSASSSKCSGPRKVFAKPPVVSLPDERLYKANIRAAQEYLASGNSYELCLTAQTRISATPSPTWPSTSSSSWQLYKRLQNRNPAPHAGYLRLHPTTLLSSSPERFLSYGRPPNVRYQLRPIKGTVRKGPGITREVAERLLSGSKKEVAENLMIVDLIRHDLHGVVGDDVSVKHFCRVEEYETVWQLTSVIEGGLASHVDVEEGTGLGCTVLQQCLPPGSMTGAPKKRSVEILQKLEGHRRGVYSGVFGYWDVGGGGDWSVVIRSCFKFDDRFTSGIKPTQGGNNSEEWLIGAGGAITALSEPQAEWEEMCIKLQSVLHLFSD